MTAAVWLSISALCLGLFSSVALAEQPPLPTPAADAAPSAALLDLNQATLAELEALPGIGAKRAQAILDYRSQRGGFQSVSQLLQIKGIGRAMLRKLRTLVTVGQSSSAADGVRLGA